MKTLSLFFLFFINFFVFCQERKEYSGEFNNGFATYSYYENENQERIFDGKFIYKSTSYAFNGNITDYFEYTGSYKDNLRDGEWIIISKNLNNHFKQGNYSEIIITKGKYLDGKKIGKWVSNKTFQINDKKFYSTLEINYNYQNKMVGLYDDFKFNENSLTPVSTGGSSLKRINFKGNFDDVGNFKENWYLSALDPINGDVEILATFYRNVFTKLIVRVKSSGKVLFNYNNEELVSTFFNSNDTSNFIFNNEKFVLNTFDDNNLEFYISQLYKDLDYGQKNEQLNYYKYFLLFNFKHDFYDDFRPELSHSKICQFPQLLAPKRLNKKEYEEMNETKNSIEYENQINQQLFYNSDQYKILYEIDLSLRNFAFKHDVERIDEYRSRMVGFKDSFLLSAGNNFKAFFEIEKNSKYNYWIKDYNAETNLMTIHFNKRRFNSGNRTLSFDENQHSFTTDLKIEPQHYLKLLETQGKEFIPTTDSKKWKFINYNLFPTEFTTSNGVVFKLNFTTNLKISDLEISSFQIYSDNEYIENHIFNFLDFEIEYEKRMHEIKILEAKKLINEAEILIANYEYSNAKKLFETSNSIFFQESNNERILFLNNEIQKYDSLINLMKNEFLSLNELQKKQESLEPFTTFIHKNAHKSAEIFFGFYSKFRDSLILTRNEKRKIQEFIDSIPMDRHEWNSENDEILQKIILYKNRQNVLNNFTNKINQFNDKKKIKEFKKILNKNTDINTIYSELTKLIDN
jgi:hypothetical protein